MDDDESVEEGEGERHAALLGDSRMPTRINTNNPFIVVVLLLLLLLLVYVEFPTSLWIADTRCLMMITSSCVPHKLLPYG